MNKCIYHYLLIFSSLLLFACVNRDKSDSEDSTELPQIDDTTDVESDTLAPIWSYDAVVDTLQYLGHQDTIDLSVGELIRIVNDRFAGNQVVLDSLTRRNDTLFVQIDSAHYLTSRMGSAGAREYMAIATFTLTEAAGTNYVSFDFEEGDHAGPGVYDRLYFQKKK